MKRQSTVLLVAAVLGLGAYGCFKDPVSDLQGSPARVSLSRRSVIQTVNDTDVVNIQVLDAQGNPLALSGVTFTSLDPLVAVMEPLPDSVLRNFPGNTLTKATLIAKGAGQTKIVIAANGVNDTLSVVSAPGTFTGTISAARAGDTITIAVPTTGPAITFSTTATAVSITNPSALYQFVSRSATQLKYIAGGITSGDHVTITGAVLLGSIPLPPLRSSAAFAVTAEAAEPANDVFGGGRVLAVPTVVGDTTFVVASSGPADVNDFYTFTTTTAGVGDSLEISLDWPDSHIDIDLHTRTAANVNAGSALTAADPEIVRRRYPAGTYQIRVEFYDASTGFAPTGYRIKIRKRA